MTTFNDEHGQPGGGINRKHREHRSHTEMIGLCKGVLADGIVCAAEARFLLDWFTANPEAANSWPGDHLFKRLEDIWEDGVATEDELADLKELLSHLTGVTDQTLAASLPHNTSSTLPLNNPPPLVEFVGKSFCFTGKMVIGQRTHCQAMVKERGGLICPNPVTTCNYLVIGELGSQDWKQTSYGNKILKAVDFRDKGHPINIISEQWWAEAL